MLLLVWDRFAMTGLECRIVRDAMPLTDFVGSIPLYTYDKHTAVGRKALALLPGRCSELKSLLSDGVPSERHADVTLMAAFYADAAPIAQRLEWHSGRLLEYVGFQADMFSSGCPTEASTSIVKCVQSNLSTLNQLRRACLLGY
jgi:hypothetical protein